MKRIKNEIEQSRDRVENNDNSYKYDPLKTSLFNYRDKITPIKKYFYDKDGFMQVEGKIKKEIGLR